MAADRSRSRHEPLEAARCSSSPDGRIDAIVEAILRQEEAGASIDDVGIQQQYAELMPELGEALRTARIIQAAAQRARQTSPSTDASDPHAAPFGDDLALLDEALDGYDILERLDHGGQGVVYKAVQKATGRTVALKVLLDGPLASDRQRHRFEREVRLVSRLRHPNIVTLYDSGVVRGRQYFAMEHVEGMPISDYVLFHRPPVEAVVRLFVTVCRAINSAHQRGIIHRDLKPGNILVDLDGEPHVLDFGLAKCLGDDEGATISLAGQVAGTLAFLSPEQAAEGDADVRSDIYALGLILYRLVTGAFPYSVHGEPSAVRTNIRTQVPRPLNLAMQDPDVGIRPTTGPVSDDLEHIILKALAKEPPRRYQSADAFADDLDRYLAGDAVEAKADSSLYILRKTIRKYRVHATFAAVIFVLLIASSVMVTSLWWQARAERDNARQVAVLAHATLADVVGEFETSIRTLAGGTKVRDRLLGRMADKLERLRPLVEADVALEGVAAELREKQGDIAAAMGRRAEAAEHYRACLDITRQRAGLRPGPRARDDAHRTSSTEAGGDAGVDDDLSAVAANHKAAQNAEAWLAVGRAHRKLAAVVDEADGHYARAIELEAEILRRRPGDSDATLELCATRTALAQRFYDAGQYEQAARQADAAVVLAGGDQGGTEADFNTGDPRQGDLLATARGLVGRSLLKLGDGASGLAALEDSLALRRQMSEQCPTDVQRRHTLLTTCAAMATAYHDAGRPDRATALLEEAVRAGEYLTSADPTVTTWRRDLYYAHHQLARFRQEAGDLDSATSHCAAAVQLAEGLVAEEPDNPEWRRISAFSYIRRGRLELDRGELQSARKDFERALAIRAGLAEAEPENLALQDDLAMAHDWLGKCVSRLGRAEEARQHYAAAHEIRRSLLAAQPEVTKRALDVILSQTKLATWHLHQQTVDDDAAATKLLDEAEASLTALHEAGKLSAWEGRYAAWMGEIEKSRRVIARRRTDREGRASGPPD
ncbi:MAG: protein kinase [Planctomycetota bacterium]